MCVRVCACVNSQIAVSLGLDYGGLWHRNRGVDGSLLPQGICVNVCVLGGGGDEEQTAGDHRES